MAHEQTGFGGDEGQRVVGVHCYRLSIATAQPLPVFKVQACGAVESQHLAWELLDGLHAGLHFRAKCPVGPQAQQCVNA